MSTLTAERLTTGNEVLDMEIPLLTDEELVKLADYAKFLRWSREDDDDWADAPLTKEEEAQLRQGREEFARGEYLTLDEFLKGLSENALFRKMND